jgi:hypothetical protein
VIVSFPDHLKHCFPLRCQFRFLLAVRQNRFRLILIPGFVKPLINADFRRSVFIRVICG